MKLLRMLLRLYVFLIVKKNNELPSDVHRSFFSSRSAFSRRFVPPATSGQYEDRLRIVSLDPAGSELVPLGSSSSLVEKVAEEKEEKQEEAVEYQQGELVC
ncbi:unnamed protein product [Lasius platythorax]|uniref:Uncharacterized protein n=1 Tax=Lasius platythorax TaxID=488582 RepID=A0AAV2P4S2_9HYME